MYSLFCTQHSQQTVPVLWGARGQQRWASSLPMNTVILFVPQQEAWVVERMGRFHRILEPVSSSNGINRLNLFAAPNILFKLLQGLNFLIPILDRIRYVQSLKEIVIDVPEQSAVSLGRWRMSARVSLSFYYNVLLKWIRYVLLLDNVTLQIDGVLYLRILDPFKVGYNSI